MISKDILNDQNMQQSTIYYNPYFKKRKTRKKLFIKFIIKSILSPNECSYV